MTRERAATGRRRADVRRGLKLGIQIVTALLSLAIVLGSGWGWAAYRDFQNGIVRTNALPGSGPDGGVGVDDGEDQNIVLVGKDDRSTATDEQLEELGTERDGGSVLTDTMMILHVPADGSRATLISFPRDSWVSIPGVGKAKLNAAYAYGSNFGEDPDAGRQLLIQTLQNITGLTVDHYVEIDLLGFFNISNAIGGVEVNLCRAQQDEDSGIDLPAGKQKIHGRDAMAFVRQRKGLDEYGGDLARAQRQQYFLTQVFKQVQSAGVLLNPVKLQNLLNAVSGSLTMDDALDPLQLAKQMANLSAGNIVTGMIPNLGIGESPDGQSIINLDFSAIPDFIATVIGTATDSTLTNAPTVAPSSFTVDVLNGAGITGIAADNAAALAALGFLVGDVADAPSDTASTTIQYPDGMQGQAKTLAAQIPGVVLSKSSTVDRVTLIIGQNAVQVTSANPQPATPPSTPTSSANTSSSPSPTPSPSVEDTRTGSDDSCID